MKAMCEAVYRALGGGKAKPEMMVDRKARGELARAIEDFSSRRISAFAFDDAISNIQDLTRDITVHNTGADLWFLYDDVHDHKFDGGKEVWDYMERLRLILLSDGHYLTHREFVGAYAMTGAVANWALLAILAYSWPPGEFKLSGSFWWGIFPWFVFIGYCCWRILTKTLEERKASLAVQKLCPFNSMVQIRAVRSKQSEFVKRKYPGKRVEIVPFHKFSRQSSIEGTRLQPFYDFLLNLIYWFLLMAMAPFIFPLVALFEGSVIDTVILPEES